jgi:hypothetical protein
MTVSPTASMLRAESREYVSRASSYDERRDELGHRGEQQHAPQPDRPAATA